MQKLYMIILILLLLPTHASSKSEWEVTQVLNAEQFREFIVRPTLKDLDMWSPAAEDLMVGTAVQESKLTYLTQHGNGPAKGLYQIEIATAVDIVDRYLLRHDKTELKHKFWAAADFDGDLYETKELMESRLASNLKYSTAIARLRYYMVPEALPEEGDIEGYARYWKKYYNTHLGGGTEEEFIKNYKENVL